MRVVLDTNVLVRATKHATGPARELLLVFESGAHELVLSGYILTEVLRVLSYPRLRAVHQLNDEECLDFVQSLNDLADVLDVQHDPTLPISNDPDDDPVIATAIQGNAEVLCTLDRHLRTPKVVDYCRQHGIEILSDNELLNLLRTMDSPSDDSE